MAGDGEGPYGLAELVRSFLAVFIVILGLLAIVLAYGFRSLGDAERLATLFSGFIGIVLGYYFGRLGVDRAESRASQADTERKEIQRKTEKFDEFRTKMEDYREYAKEYMRVIEFMEQQHPEVAKKVDEYLEALEE